jgi:hypothetical protein
MGQARLAGAAWTFSSREAAHVEDLAFAPPGNDWACCPFPSHEGSPGLGSVLRTDRALPLFWGISCIEHRARNGISPERPRRNELVAKVNQLATIRGASRSHRGVGIHAGLESPGSPKRPGIEEADSLWRHGIHLGSPTHAVPGGFWTRPWSWVDAVCGSSPVRMIPASGDCLETPTGLAVSGPVFIIELAPGCAHSERCAMQRRSASIAGI